MTVASLVCVGKKQTLTFSFFLTLPFRNLTQKNRCAKTHCLVCLMINFLSVILLVLLCSGFGGCLRKNAPQKQGRIIINNKKQKNIKRIILNTIFPGFRIWIYMKKVYKRLESSQVKLNTLCIVLSTQHKYKIAPPPALARWLSSFSF